MKSLFYKKYISTGQKRNNFSYTIFLRTIITRFFPIEKNLPILEIGCGSGELLLEAKKLGYSKIDGIEISEEMIKNADSSIKQNIKKTNLLKFLKLQSPNKYKAIIAKDILEHFSKKELLYILKRAHHCLMPNGYLVGHVPNGFSIWGSAIFWSDATHETAFTEDSLTQWCKVVGFSHVEVWEDYPMGPRLKDKLRKVLWKIGSFPFRILLAAETGKINNKITMNLFFKAYY